MFKSSTAKRLRERLDIVVLAGLAVILLSGWIFIELADEVVEGEAQKWDQLILQSLSESGEKWDPIGPPWFEEFWRDMTALGSVGITVFVTTAVTVYFVLLRKKSLIYLVLGAYAGAGILALVLKALFERPRPETLTELASTS